MSFMKHPCVYATASCFSDVRSKHFLVKTEDSPGGLDGPSDSGDYAASLNRQGGQFFRCASISCIGYECRALIFS